MIEIPDGWTKGYHFLRVDMTAGSGNEPPWQDGETRTYTGKVVICESGYHWCRDWYDCLEYASGPVGCIVAASPPAQEHSDKCVSQSRMLLAHVNVERVLRLYACLCAERALQREKDAGREPDPRSWTAIAVSRRYAAGEATEAELEAAWAAEAAMEAAWAAREAAWAAAWAASAAAWEAASAAAEAAMEAAWAAGEAAWAAELEWQRETFNAMMDEAFAEVAV